MIVLLSGTAAIVAVLLLPVHVTGSIDAPGKVIAAREWVLLQQPNGTILSLLRSNLAGTVSRVDVMYPERGELTSTVLTGCPPAQSIACGDTVARTVSTSMATTMATLRGALAVAEAAVSAARSGQKPAVVREAAAQLEAARSAADTQQRLMHRRKELHRTGVMSDEEFEQYRGQLELVTIHTAIAEAHLEAVSTGEREEEISLLRSEIDAIRGQLNAVEQRIALSCHISPIHGITMEAHGVDTLFVVADTVQCLVLIPVPLEKLALLRNGSRLLLRQDETSATGEGEILAISGDAHYHNGEAWTVVKARVTGCDRAIPPGRFVRCRIDTESVPLRIFVYRFLQSLLS
ncbi:MAG: hypothetical protein RRA94_01985 [Bacteroidota bacterium]|nr:hypothetical protein [Bacteroidota bacterium]